MSIKCELRTKCEEVIKYIDEVRNVIDLTTTLAGDEYFAHGIIASNKLITLKQNLDVAFGIDDDIPLDAMRFLFELIDSYRKDAHEILMGVTNYITKSKKEKASDKKGVGICVLPGKYFRKPFTGMAVTTIDAQGNVRDSEAIKDNVEETHGLTLDGLQENAKLLKSMRTAKIFWEAE